MAQFLGKLLIVGGLGFQAYSLFTHNETASKFGTNFARALKRGTQYGVDLTEVLQDKTEIARQVIVALYALSALILLTKSKFIKFLVILGVILNTLIMTNPLVDKSEGVALLLFQNIAIIGGLIFLSGSQCRKVQIQNPIPNKKVTQTKPATTDDKSTGKKKRT